MGLAQKISFEFNKGELIETLKKLDYKKENNLLIKKSELFLIELSIEKYGLYIHCSGQYFYEFGLLIETLGNITPNILIEDN